MREMAVFDLVTAQKKGCEFLSSVFAHHVLISFKVKSRLNAKSTESLISIHELLPFLQLEFSAGVE